ncbi:3-dehydrosphinganine reductase [Marasmius crinis-equi]|uniref:3-dehydrosphinganine reductase n=1 Tax=Marasmius crinis-equi TaxID=585013 RepID=A0ABR3FQI0_9AGAR
MVQKGAHVSIVARNKERLDQALVTLEVIMPLPSPPATNVRSQENRLNPNQKLNAYSFALDTAAESSKALNAACEAHDGHAPDAVFACAGSSKPKFFLEMSEDELANGMVNAYWVQAWTAWAAAKMMVRQQRKGKILLVSSTLGFMAFLGYSSYAPGKHALRALGDTLQSELMLYDIDVHTFFPPTMVTDGYMEEMKTKPAITHEIEGTDPGMSTEHAALVVFRGIQKGQLHIAGDLITNLFRSCSRGAAPRNNFLLDTLYDIATWIAVPVWRMMVDKQVKNHRDEHLEYLRANGFFD